LKTYKSYKFLTLLMTTKPTKIVWDPCGIYVTISHSAAFMTHGTLVFVFLSFAQSDRKGAKEDELKHLLFVGPSQSS
jgi:hypothetical protein